MPGILIATALLLTPASTQDRPALFENSLRRTPRGFPYWYAREQGGMERLTGIPGAFSTRIAYVTVEGKAPARRHRLVVADADGFNPRTVAESGDPLMSPAWSPDGQSLAYVSFEGRSSAIFVQRLATGERRRVSARAGINGAPAFSPDGPASRSRSRATAISTSTCSSSRPRR